MSSRLRPSISRFLLFAVFALFALAPASKADTLPRTASGSLLLTPGTYYSTIFYNPGTLIASSREPGTLLLLGCGLLLLGSVTLRKP
jgi:hypothetical protein